MKKLKKGAGNLFCNAQECFVKSQGLKMSQASLPSEFFLNLGKCEEENVPMPLSMDKNAQGHNTFKNPSSE